MTVSSVHCSFQQHRSTDGFTKSSPRGLLQRNSTCSSVKQRAAAHPQPATRDHGAGAGGGILARCSEDAVRMQTGPRPQTGPGEPANTVSANWSSH